MHLISALIDAIGYSIDDFIISRDAIGRVRKEKRREIANNVKTKFKVVKSYFTIDSFDLTLFTSLRLILRQCIGTENFFAI